MENFDKGMKLFNEGKFFEAHQEWERQWREMPDSTERHLLQGMILISGALYQYKRKEYASTLKLLEKGIKKLSEFKGSTPGINIDKENFLKEVILFQEKFKLSNNKLSERNSPRIEKLKSV